MKAYTSLIELVDETVNRIEYDVEFLERKSRGEIDEDENEETLPDLARDSDLETLEIMRQCARAISSMIQVTKMLEEYMEGQIGPTKFKRRFKKFNKNLEKHIKDSDIENKLGVIQPTVIDFLKKFQG